MEAKSLFGRGPTDDGHVAGWDSVFLASPCVLRIFPECFARERFPDYCSQKFAGALGCAYINFRMLRSAGNLLRLFHRVEIFALRPAPQCFGASLMDSDWLMDVESTRNRLEMPLYCFRILVQSIARQ